MTDHKPFAGIPITLDSSLAPNEIRLVNPDDRTKDVIFQIDQGDEASDRAAFADRDAAFSAHMAAQEAVGEDVRAYQVWRWDCPYCLTVNYRGEDALEPTDECDVCDLPVRVSS